MWELTSHELRQFDAGGWFSDGYSGVKVPILEEFLDLLEEEGVGGFLDVKQPGIVEDVVGKVQRWGLEDRVVVHSEHWGSVRKVKELNPAITTQISLPRPSAASLRGALMALANIVSIHTSALNPQVVALAHRRGLLVDVWGIRTEEEVRSALEYGVDFITAADPALVKTTIEKVGF